MDKGKAFRSSMSRGETAAALCWFPVHLLVLPILLVLLVPQISGPDLNFWVFAIGAAALVGLCFRFLRRDFDVLCERPGAILLQLALSWVLLILSSWAVNLILTLTGDWLAPENNPNQSALAALAGQERGKIVAMSLFLAPLVEELMFRGGVFGLLRRWGRLPAYLGCMLLFAAYHTWQYALDDPRYLLYSLQYLPPAWVLCRCYERTETIWAPILFHVLNNALSLWTMNLLGG